MPGHVEASLSCALCQIGFHCPLSHVLARPPCQILGHGLPCGTQCSADFSSAWKHCFRVALTPLSSSLLC